MGKISDQSSLGTRQATAEVELIYGGQNYRQSVSVLFTGFYPADNDATLAANSSSLVPTQAAVKSYVDSSIYGLKWKQSVRAATTAALTLATDFENGDIIDGYTLQTGDRILIKNQVSAIDNGIYVVAASGAPSRAADADSGTELVSASVMVERGTVNADTQWTCTANTIAIGVSNITWAQITSSGVADGDYGDIVVSSGAWALDSAITFSGKTLTGGTLSGVAISGASSIATTVSIDANTSAFTLHDNSDTTKTATFGVSGITTGTNRVFTLPNASGTIALTGAITTSGFTQATGKMLGRSTASTGAVEEITVGTGLSLASGTLRMAPSIQSVSSSATVTPTFTDDAVKITAQAAALSLANPTGTAVPMHGMVIRIKDNGTARAISYDTQYRAIGITLPTTTVISKTTYIAMIYNSDDTKWDCIATGTEA